MIENPKPTVLINPLYLGLFNPKDWNADANPWLKWKPKTTIDNT